MKLFIATILALTACTQKPSSEAMRPEALVESFVRMSSDVKSTDDLKKLSGLCQGRMKQAFEGISSEAFLVSYVNQPIKIKSLKIVQTALDGNLARVHYLVETENPNGQEPTIESSEREVELLKVDGNWYLEAIRPKGSDQIAFTRGMIF
jgi:hypothetical protein